MNTTMNMVPSRPDCVSLMPNSFWMSGSATATM